MNPVKIAQRYHPFSHRPGTLCFLPGSTIALVCFPTLVRIFDYSNSDPVHIQDYRLPHQGPCTEFTVQQDLEKMCVKIWGFSSTGYFQYRCVPISEAPYIIFDKESKPCIEAPTERLSLGESKAQDIELIHRRQDLKEILPIWLRLGLTLPIALSDLPNNPSLLTECYQASKETIYPSLLALFKAGFSSLFFPRARDTDLQGYQFHPVAEGVHPIQILRQGVPLIRELFCRSSADGITIFPNRPNDFHSGRYIGIPCHPFGVLQIEWSSHLLKKLILTSTSHLPLTFHLPKEIKRMRIRTSESKEVKWISSTSSIDIVPGSQYFLDRFEH